MFNNVLRCLVSRATIGIAASVTARPRRSPQRSRQLRRTAGIGDNSAEIGDDAAGIVNGDWSNSVPGGQFPNRLSPKSAPKYLIIFDTLIRPTFSSLMITGCQGQELLLSDLSVVYFFC